MTPNSYLFRNLGCASLMVCCVWNAAGSLVHGQYTPQHSKVRQMVAGGVQFLNSTPTSGTSSAFGLGSQALVGYALYKATGDDKLPNVVRGIDASRRLAASLASLRSTGESKIMYEICVAGVLLASVDAAKYQPELLVIRDWLLEVQKPHGGFGYLGRPTGDTSQVQYVMLVFWTMQQVGMDVPETAIESCVDYLRATMDPSGSYGYQGIVGNGRLVKQENPSKSLGTAGAGALIIAGDALGVFGARKDPKDDAEGIPDAFKRVDLEKARRKRGRVTLKKSDLDGQLQRIRQYQNSSRFTGSLWYFYWRYSQERYESFHEIVEGKQEKSPAWYNAGVEDLASAQDAEGAWGKSSRRDVLCAPDVCTAFSVLFLIRSTQKAIGKLDEGLAFGGRQLPGKISQVKMVGDRIVSAEQASVESLLGMLEDDATAGIEVGLLPPNLKLSTDPATRKSEVARMGRLLESADHNARRIAAKLLGRSDDLDQVPNLIFGLSDTDPYVPAIAEESLRLLSRQLTVGNLKVDPTPEQKDAAITRWKKWYLGLRPDYIFIDR